MRTLEWYLGTMGFSYKDWEGVFYPPGLKQRDYLAHYSRFFNAVEVDSTFYGTPRADTVKRWGQMTPADFVLCLKMPRIITHELRLADAEEEVEAFLETARLLGEKLGPILIQFPPDFARDQIGVLAAFLRGLPHDVGYAVEFRHRSWHATATGMLLQKHGVAWVSTEYQYMPQRVYVTADFVYVRWIGRHGTYETHDHEREDKGPRLQEWLEDIRSRQEEEGFGAVYGFFNNDYAGFSPATCQTFKGLVGLPTKPLEPPQQASLFGDD